MVLSQKFSKKGIKIDNVKIEVIKKLPPPIFVKVIRRFFGACKIL